VKRFVCIAAALLLAACSSGLDQKIDGSSEKAFESSLARMKQSAQPDEAAKLDDSLLVLAISDVSIGYEGGILRALAKISMQKSPEQLAEQLMPLVNGKTGREVIAAGQKRKKDEAAKQLAALEKESAQLRKLRDEKATTRGVLELIQVLEPTLRFSSVGPQKISLMDFRVMNGTDVPLTYLYLRGTVSAPASNKVLFSDDINYRLAEALAPGATKELRLPNSSPGKWNAPEIWGKDNLAFAIEVVNAETGPGHKLAAAFTFKDGERLLLLEKQKPELEKIVQGK
jgi:hypothetical protein